jgi:hypothetical protein
MSQIAEAGKPGQADTYEQAHIQLADTYDMGLFENDIDDQKEPLYGFHIWGPCPRCGHTSSGLVPVKYLETSPLGADPITEPIGEARDRVYAAKRRAPAGEAEKVVFVTGDMRRREARTGYDLKAVALTCCCQVTHDHQNGKLGCGAEWMVAFEYIHNTNRKDITLSVVDAKTAARSWVAADTISASVAAAGQTAMGLAAKWVAALSTAVALITLGGILGGRDTIQALPGWAQGVLAAAILMALYANVSMIYQGNIAGNGYPALKTTLGQRSLIDADIRPLREAQASIERLDRAKSWAMATGVATLTAVGIFLFIPSAGTGHVKVKYTDTNSIVHQTSCGILSTDESGNPQSFKADRGSHITFSSPTSVEIDAC